MHAEQLAPPVPQAVSVDPGRHALPWQHPLGQLVPSQMQLPPTQRCPAPQAGFVPHRHAPLAQVSATLALHAVQAAPPLPHWFVLWPVVMHAPPAVQQPVGQLLASQTQAPPTQRCPGWHAGPVPQAHAPETQPLLRVPSQATQLAPPVPHWLDEGVVHTPAAQQPDGQVAGLHPAQTPLLQGAAPAHA